MVTLAPVHRLSSPHHFDERSRQARRSPEGLFAGTDSRVFALCITYDRGRDDTKSCMAGVDSRVYAPCRPRVWGKLRDQWVEVLEVEQWQLVGKTGLSSLFVEQSQ